jgi:hypothetical protein
MRKLRGVLSSVLLLLFFIAVAGATTVRPNEAVAPAAGALIGSAAKTYSPAGSIAVPEPGFYGLLAIGLAILFVIVKYRRKQTV